MRSLLSLALTLSLQSLPAQCKLDIDRVDPIEKTRTRATKPVREINPYDAIVLTFAIFDTTLFLQSTYLDDKIRSNSVSEGDFLHVVLEGGEVVSMPAASSRKSRWGEVKGTETVGTYALEEEQLVSLANKDWTLIRMELGAGNEDFLPRKTKQHRTNAVCIFEQWKSNSNPKK